MHFRRWSERYCAAFATSAGLQILIFIFFPVPTAQVIGWRDGGVGKKDTKATELLSIMLCVGCTHRWHGWSRGRFFFYSGKAETFQNRCHLQKSSQNPGKGASEIVVQNPPKKCDTEDGGGE